MKNPNPAIDAKTSQRHSPSRALRSAHAFERQYVKQHLERVQATPRPESDDQLPALCSHSLW